MILTTEIVKEKVAEGDKFSTETQLIEKLGFPKAKGNTKFEDINELLEIVRLDLINDVKTKIQLMTEWMSALCMG